MGAGQKRPRPVVNQADLLVSVQAVPQMRIGRTLNRTNVTPHHC